LKRINLPSTLEEIGISAFRNCEKLEDIIVPDGLRSLEIWAFSNCKSIQIINIPPNLKTIGQAAFLSCHSLTDIAFSEGLLKISQRAFSFCTSLVSITLPSSLKVIGREAFDGCERLNEIHIPHTIESIERGAFRSCNFTNFRMPPHMADVDTNILMENYGLVSVELSENATFIECLLNRNSLRNIVFPSNCAINTIGSGGRKNLEVVFPDGEYGTIVPALQNRFDDLPIHKICYYHSYHDTETTMQSLRQVMDSTGKQQDCLGMTPLHILACSTKQNVEMFRLLIEKYPETLITKDKWGDIPLLYAIWCNAPIEVLELLGESYKSLHPDYEFDWSGMIQTLAKRNVPLTNIQNLTNTYRQISPVYNCDVQDLVMELVLNDTKQARAVYRTITRIETLRYLLKVSISKRLDSLAVGEWRVELENSINALPKKAEYREEYTQAVYDKLAAYELIKEGTSILELALWKAKIDEGRNKRARADGEVSYRGQCRVSCGADIIVRNVLPYLMPK